MEMARARHRLELMLQAYVDTSHLAEQNRSKEHGAVILLQCAWRRRRVYNLLRKWNKAAVNIQRLVRGHFGRERFQSIGRARDTKLRVAYFNHKATTIQRWFRGFYSRKHTHSYYARKEFLLEAMARNSEVKNGIFANFMNQWNARIEKVSTRTQQEMDKFFRSSHFFLGTEVEEGMYYSHYLRVLGEPNIIENKIKESRKKLDCVAEMKRLKRRPRPPPLWRSKYYITSVGPYFTRFDVRMAEDKRRRENRLMPEDFIVYTKKQDKLDMFKGPTVRVQTEYEAHKTKDQKGWRRISDKPFFVAVPRRRRFSCGGL